MQQGPVCLITTGTWPVNPRQGLDLMLARGTGVGSWELSGGRPPRLPHQAVSENLGRKMRRETLQSYLWQKQLSSCYQMRAVSKSSEGACLKFWAAPYNPGHSSGPALLMIASPRSGFLFAQDHRPAQGHSCHSPIFSCCLLVLLFPRGNCRSLVGPLEGSCSAV